MKKIPSAKKVRIIMEERTAPKMLEIKKQIIENLEQSFEKIKNGALADYIVFDAADYNFPTFYLLKLIREILKGKGFNVVLNHINQIEVRWDE